MRTGFLLIVFVFRLASAQTAWQYAYQDKNTSGRLVLNSCGRVYLISEYRDAVFSSGFFIHGYDESGNFKFKSDISLGEYSGISGAMVSSDGKLVVTGYYSSSCHVPNPVGFWKKLDTNGIVLATKLFNSGTFSDIEFKNSIQLPNGKYCLASNTKLYQYDALSNTYTTTSIPGMINSLGVSSSGRLFVNIYQNTPGPMETLELDSLLNIVQTHSATGLYTGILYKANAYYTLSQQGFIQKRDLNLNVVITSSISQNHAIGNKLTCFVSDMDTIYGIGNNAQNGKSFYLRLDSNLHLISFKSSDNKLLPPTSISKVNANCYTSHALTSTLNLPMHTGIQAFPLDSIYSFKHDLCLRSVEAKNPLIFYYGAFGASLTYKIKATILNTGNNTITNFYLNARLNDNLGNCNKSLFSEQIQGINLLPGDSIVYEPNTLIYDATTQWNSQNYVLKTSFCVSAPNNEMDGTVTDNIKATNQVVPNDFVFLQEKKDTETEINVYPNPSQGSFKILVPESSMQNSILEVRDLLGKLIVLQKLSGNEKVEFSINNYQNGVYLLSILDEAGQLLFANKVIKQD